MSEQAKEHRSIIYKAMLGLLLLDFYYRDRHGKASYYPKVIPVELRGDHLFVRVLVSNQYQFKKLKIDSIYSMRITQASFKENEHRPEKLIYDGAEI